MTELQAIIKQLIEKQYTLKNIKDILNIEDYKIIRTIDSLKKKGYSIERKYNENGESFFSIGDLKNETIKIDNIKDNITLGVLAESHLGCYKERLDYLDMATNYFEKKGIHYVINGGDLVDGLKNSRFRTLEGEVNYAIKNYPKSDTITTFLTLGDHDRKIMESGCNIEEKIHRKRLDLIAIGTEKGILQIGKDTIGILHKKSKKRSIYQEKITLLAHGHKAGNRMLENHLKIHIPPLSDVVIGGFAPGFLVLYLEFDKEKEIKNICIQRMIFSSDILLANEDEFEFQKTKTRKKINKRGESSKEKILLANP